MSQQLRHVTRLTLTEFRNYAHLRVEPARPLVALTGANGAGKTNLLEAVSLLIPGRGLRGVEFQALARQGGSGQWAVAASVRTPNGEMEVGTGWRPTEEGDPSSSRAVMIDGLQQKSAGSLSGLMRMVWLTPAMDRLFQGAPGDRRRFLDRMVVLFDADHASRVNAFEKLMRERNALLSDANPDAAWLASLEVQMAESGRGGVGGPAGGDQHPCPPCGAVRASRTISLGGIVDHGCHGRPGDAAFRRRSGRHVPPRPGAWPGA